MELVDCPGRCGARLPENDVSAQMAHMQGHHSDIIAERLKGAGILPRGGAERLARFDPDAEVLRGPSMLAGVVDRMRLHRAVDSYAADEIERTLDVLRDNGWSGAITADTAVAELARGVQRLGAVLEKVRTFADLAAEGGVPVSVELVNGLAVSVDEDA